MLRTIALLIAVSLGTAPSFAQDPSIAERIADLDSPQAETRERALLSLSGKTALAQAAIPKVIALASDANERVGFAAIRLLAEFGPAAKEALPVLKKLSQQKPASEFRRLDFAHAMLTISAGADKEAVRFALPLKYVKSGTPLVDESAVARYPAHLATSLIELLADVDPAIRTRAAEVLGLFAITPIQKVPVPQYLVQAGEAGKKIAPALQGALADKEATVRGAAALSLARVKPDAGDAYLPVLLALLQAKQIPSEAAAPSLQRVGKQALGPLIEMLPDTDEGFRHDLGVILWGFHAEAVPVLAEALRHKHPQVRRGVAYALHGFHNNGGAQAMPALVAALRDEHPGVRLEVAEAIAAIKPLQAQPAVPVLIALLAESREDYRQEAAQCLGTVAKLAQSAAPTLVKTLSDQSPNVRLAAAHSLVEIDLSAAVAAVPVLIDVGLSEKHGDPERTAKDLGRIGPPAASALPHLKKRLKDGGGPVLAAAALAITKIDSASTAEAVAALTRVATQPNKGYGEYVLALRALGQLGDVAKPALPALAKMLASKKGFQQGDIAGTMLRIDPRDAAALAFYHQQLKPNDDGISYGVMRGLRKIGAAGTELIPDLLIALADQRADNQGIAADVLAEIGPAAKTALPALRDQLAKAKDSSTKVQIERAIRAIQGADKK